MCVRAHVHMHVRMYVGMYASMYARMSVCACRNACTHVIIHIYSYMICRVDIIRHQHQHHPTPTGHYIRDITFHTHSHNSVAWCTACGHLHATGQQHGTMALIHCAPERQAATRFQVSNCSLWFQLGDPGKSAMAQI